jgi:hypothetical protein
LLDIGRAAAGIARPLRRVAGRTSRELNANARPLRRNDFRRARTYYADHVFAVHREGGSAELDLVDLDTWAHLIELPTDVALRTTTLAGSTTRRLAELSSAWLFSIPRAAAGPAAFTDAAMHAFEEFEAAQFNTVHGFYRQAIACLRTAIELMAHSAGYACAADTAGFARWRSGRIEPAFRSSCQRAHTRGAGARLDAAIAPESVFDSSNGWGVDLYGRLSPYTHAKAGHINTDLWQSNGPVWEPSAHDLVASLFEESMAFSTACLTLVCAPYRLPALLSKMFASPGPAWAAVAQRLLAII